MLKSLCTAAILLMAFCGLAQKKSNPKEAAPASTEEIALFKNLEYRLIGPFRGGRSAAVGGSYRHKNTFYFGATGAKTP
jgi:hypothetical protein